MSGNCRLSMFFDHCHMLGVIDLQKIDPFTHRLWMSINVVRVTSLLSPGFNKRYGRSKNYAHVCFFFFFFFQNDSVHIRLRVTFFWKSVKSYFLLAALYQVAVPVAGGQQSLVMIMAYRLIGAKSSSEIVIYFHDF